jgi:hypothetical protein
MQQLDVTFTPQNGGPPRKITLRIGTPVNGEHSWTTRLEILGFEESHAWTVQGEDWVHVLELSAIDLPFALDTMVKRAGGGTLDPYFYERDPRPSAELPPEVRGNEDTPRTNEDSR